MAFRIFKPVSHAGKLTGLRAGLIKYKNSKSANLTITIAGALRKEMGLSDVAGFEVAIGEDEVHGLIRLRSVAVADVEKGEVEGIAVKPSKARGGDFYRLNLGRVDLFLNEPQKMQQCQWEDVGDGWYEFALPEWADKTRPRPKDAVAAVPPAVLRAKSAGDADKARQDDERREADERRRSLAEGEEDAERELQLKNPPRVEKPFADVFGFSRSEGAIMRILVANRGAVVTRDKLMHELYFDRADDPPAEKVFDVWICKIRDKLKKAPHVICRIETRHGEGWLLKGSIAGLYDEASAAA